MAAVLAILLVFVQSLMSNQKITFKVKYLSNNSFSCTWILLPLDIAWKFLVPQHTHSTVNDPNPVWFHLTPLTATFGK